MFFCGECNGYTVRFSLQQAYTEIILAMENPRLILVGKFSGDVPSILPKGAIFRGNFTNRDTLSVLCNGIEVIITDVRLDTGECQEI